MDVQVIKKAFFNIISNQQIYVVRNTLRLSTIAGPTERSIRYLFNFLARKSEVVSAFHFYLCPHHITHNSIKIL